MSASIGRRGRPFLTWEWKGVRGKYKNWEKVKNEKNHLRTTHYIVKWGSETWVNTSVMPRAWVVRRERWREIFAMAAQSESEWECSEKKSKRDLCNGRPRPSSEDDLRSVLSQLYKNSQNMKDGKLFCRANFYNSQNIKAGKLSCRANFYKKSKYKGWKIILQG